MILIIDNDKSTAQGLCNMFYFMGYLCRAIRPCELQATISQKYRAVVLTEPSRPDAILELVATVRRYAGAIPIFACEGAGRADGAAHGVVSFPRTVYASELSDRILSYCRQHGHPTPGEYVSGALDASIDKVTTYRDQAVCFTKTENMIVRFVIRSASSPVKPQDILKNAFRPTHLPEISNVRTHISLINRKFRELFGENLISSTPYGYTLSESISDTRLTV